MTIECTTREQLLFEVGELRRELSAAEERRASAENALRSLEHRNRLLGDSAPFGILTADIKGRITVFNRKMREMLPWPADQDATFIDLFEFEPLIETDVVEEFKRCIAMKAPVISKCFSVASHGEGRHLRFYISPVLDEVGAITGVLAFLEDVTQQKSAEEAVRESGERYRLLFQYSPIALIERDASRLKAHIEQLRESGVLDISDYLHKNPHAAARCMSMINTVAFNDAFLRLLEADNPDQLRAGLYPATRRFLSDGS